MPSAAEEPTVSFVVIARDEAPTIEASLRSIMAQCVDKEIVVVDDGSRDETAQVVADLAGRRPELRLIRLPRNHGRGFARRTGVDEARGQFIAMVDADVILPSNWWRCCTAALEHADAVGGVAIPDGDVAYLNRRLSLQARPRLHTTPITGSNAVYRRELFRRTSFDPSLRDGEDVALSHALRGAGARLHTVPGLYVEHRDHRTFIETARWLFQSGRGATRQLWRYREVRAADLALAGMLGTVGCGLTRRRRGLGAALVPPTIYLAVASGAHVAFAFACERKRAHRLLGAALLDMPLLAAYFAGRIAGVAQLAAVAPEPIASRTRR